MISRFVLILIIAGLMTGYVFAGSDSDTLNPMLENQIDTSGIFSSANKPIVPADTLVLSEDELEELQEQMEDSLEEAQDRREDSLEQIQDTIDASELDIKI